MALRHDANDANLSRIADDVIGLREAIKRIDHGQDALLQNGQSLQGQLEALTGQITHTIQGLTPERPEQEGPSLADPPPRPPPSPSRLARPPCGGRPRTRCRGSPRPKPRHPTPTLPPTAPGAPDP